MRLYITNKKCAKRLYIAWNYSANTVVWIFLLYVQCMFLLKPQSSIFACLFGSLLACLSIQVPTLSFVSSYTTKLFLFLS